MDPVQTLVYSEYTLRMENNTTASSNKHNPKPKQIKPHKQASKQMNQSTAQILNKPSTAFVLFTPKIKWRLAMESMLHIPFMEKLLMIAVTDYITPVCSPKTPTC